jgi:hypothetical protein
VFQVSDPPHLFDDRDRVGLLDGKTCRVITPIFETGQTGYQQLDDRTGTYVANNAAHTKHLSMCDRDEAPTPGWVGSIREASVPGSPPGFCCSRDGHGRPGRHPPNLSMTFLLVTSLEREARRY